MEKRYYIVTKKVELKHFYEVQAENKGEAVQLVRDGKAGVAFQKREGATTYEVG